MDRADAEVVGARRGAASTCSGVCVESADEQLGAGLRARRRDAAVVLADVHAVGARGAREVGPVVDDQQRARGVAELARDARRGEQVVVVGVLVAQLEDVDAALERRAQHVGQRPAAGRDPATK